MQISFSLLAPLLLLLPAANAFDPVAPGPRGDELTIRLTVASGSISRPAAADVLAVQGAGPMADMDYPQQVSIEQRVTIRIAPRAAPMPMAPALFAQDSALDGPRFIERKFGKCLPIGGIAGVQPVSGRKLLLIMRDNRLFTAELEKGCRARDYYSGFLVAKSEDGLICKERDKLQSRSGATCEVNGFRQIVELGV